eukprot:gene32936-39833_t
MPPYFKRLQARTNRVFSRIDKGADRFFARTVPHAAQTVTHGITSTAKTVGNGIERGFKKLESSGILADALAVGGVLAAPYSGGLSLALEGAAAADTFARDARSKIKNGKAAFHAAVSDVNRAAHKGVQRAAMSTRSGLMSLAESVPVAASQQSNNYTTMAPEDSTTVH